MYKIKDKFLEFKEMEDDKRLNEFTFLENIVFEVVEIMCPVLGMFFVVILGITVPIWVIPYFIYKKNFDKNEED